MVREGGFGDKAVVDQFLSRFAENPVMHVGLPEVEDFRYRVVFEKLYICDDVEHRGLVHPVGEGDDFCGGLALAGFFAAFFGPHVDDAVGGNRVVFFEG